MRILMLYVDYFKSTLTTKGRSKLVEDPTNKITEVNDALIVITTVEKHDEPNPHIVAQKGVAEVAKLSHRLNVKTIVLHPFTRLFGQLSTPKVAIMTLQLMKDELGQQGFNVLRTPFGWFNALEIKAKGHPLSRVARRVAS